MIPITSNTGLREHQQLCSPVRPRVRQNASHSELSVPADLCVSSLLKWPGWLNTLCEHWRAMRTQGYLQPPQHSCGDTGASVAVGALCNFTLSQTQQEVRARSSGSPATLIISVQKKKQKIKPLLTFKCRAQHPVTHSITLGATLLPIPSTQSASKNWHEQLCLQNQDDFQAGSEETQTKGSRECSGDSFTRGTNKNAWNMHSHP